MFLVNYHNFMARILLKTPHCDYNQKVSLKLIWNLPSCCLAFNTKRCYLDGQSKHINGLTQCSTRILGYPPTKQEAPMGAIVSQLVQSNKLLSDRTRSLLKGGNFLPGATILVKSPWLREQQGPGQNLPLLFQ